MKKAQAKAIAAATLERITGALAGKTLLWKDLADKLDMGRPAVWAILRNRKDLFLTDRKGWVTLKQAEPVVQVPLNPLERERLELSAKLVKLQAELMKGTLEDKTMTPVQKLVLAEDQCRQATELLQQAQQLICSVVPMGSKASDKKQAAGSNHIDADRNRAMTEAIERTEKTRKK